ncbi:hypothetical protein E1292_17310 [Nonomuraea deserti]|uniref:Uncharacterized protein n=1 Tax=Nonomuraea deserti TaxID=1848322 RepID=A0A4R4VJR3_9ACTN|nr:hypothetical protein [Nonomuraea deserti]TDD05231.1 hypothetical protein E1292_17310 [Nonomuraea deserti]
MRNLRDYKVASGGDPLRGNPASPFTIIAESLRLGDFTSDEIAGLYDQHTQATGQEFTKDPREHGEMLIRQEGYHEAARQIILMAFVHRLVNGGGHLDREYAAGTKRLDVLVSWPYTGPDGERLMRREAMELKVWRSSGDDPLPEGLSQLDRYLDRLSLPTGVLVIFDRRPEAPPWKERGGCEQATTPSGRHVTVLRV